MSTESSISLTLKQPSKRTFLDFIKQQPLGFIGLVLIVIMFTCAIFAPQVAPYNPEDIDFEASPALAPKASFSPK